MTDPYGQNSASTLNSMVEALQIAEHGYKQFFGGSGTVLVGTINSRNNALLEFGSWTISMETENDSLETRLTIWVCCLVCQIEVLNTIVVLCMS